MYLIFGPDIWEAEIYVLDFFSLFDSESPQLVLSLFGGRGSMTKQTGLKCEGLKRLPCRSSCSVTGEGTEVRVTNSPSHWLGAICCAAVGRDRHSWHQGGGRRKGNVESKTIMKTKTPIAGSVNLLSDVQKSTHSSATSDPGPRKSKANDYLCGGFQYPQRVFCSFFQCLQPLHQQGESFAFRTQLSFRYLR